MKQTVLSILSNVFVMALVWWNFGFTYVLWMIGMMAVVFIIVMTALFFIFKHQHDIEKQDFYDSIQAWCGLPSAKNGRNLDAVNIKWEKGQMTNIEVKLPADVTLVRNFLEASVHIRNTIAWRYDLTDEQIALSLSKIHEGIIEAHMLTSDDPEDIAKFSELLYLDGLHRMVYKIPASLDDKIPTVEITGVEPAGKDYMFDLMTITFDKPLSDELVENFKTSFSYVYPDHQVSYSLSQECHRLEVKRVGTVS